MKNAIPVLALICLMSIVKCGIIGINITISGLDDGACNKSLPIIVSIASGAGNSTKAIESTTRSSVVTITQDPSVAAPANSTSSSNVVSASSDTASSVSTTAGNSTATAQSVAEAKSTAR